MKNCKEQYNSGDHEIEAIIDGLSDQQLHILLNKWYRIPKKFNRDAYPYPCEGFVVPNSDNKTVVSGHFVKPLFSRFSSLLAGLDA